MALPDAMATAVRAAEKLKLSGAGNEANTKAVLIEPMLAALGWDTVDPDSVEREIKVYEGTFLDYALKIRGASRVFVEAKGLSESLEDKKFIAQTINYANNEGVLWCVLTNGVRYRVYKTNEMAPMDQKLLFEIDLTDDSEPAVDKSRMFGLLTQGSLDAGDLDRFGDRVFTDGRVRKALASIGSDPPASLLKIITDTLGHPPVATETLKRSLARIFDAPTRVMLEQHGVEDSKSADPVGPPVPPKGQEYSLDHHLGNKGALIQELFNETNSFAMALGGTVTRRVRKHYLGYFRGKSSFCTIELQHKRVLVYLSLEPSAAKPWNAHAMRDVRDIGHFGMGNTEYSLTSVEQLDEIKSLVESAYSQRT